MSEELKIGYLKSSDESLIGSVAVKTGQIIYSEGPGMQFVDFENMRHTYGSVLAGLFVGSEYKDFSTLSLDEIITTIKANDVIIKNGQLIKTNDSIYMYKKVNDKYFITQLNDTAIEVSQNKVGYAIQFPNYKDGDLVDISLVVSVSSESYGEKVFLIKVEDNVINLSACEDLDGAFSSDSLGIDIINYEGLFVIVSTLSSVTLKVVSYSASSSGSSVNEGFYIAASDIVANA